MLKKFKLAIKKELIYYFLTLLLLSLLMHVDLISEPSARFELMQEKENYSHPFTYAFVVYAILLIFRKSIDFIAKIFHKKVDKIK